MGIGKKKGNVGYTLVEVLTVVNIVAILTGAVSVFIQEYSDEAKCFEIYCILPQIIRSQAHYAMRHHGQYYAAGHEDFRNFGVDVSEAQYFRYATFPNGFSSFAVRAEATAWAPGGFVHYNNRGDPEWSCDGLSIKRAWLPQ